MLKEYNENEAMFLPIHCLFLRYYIAGRVVLVTVVGRFGQRMFWPGCFGLEPFGLGHFGQAFLSNRTFWPDRFKNQL